MDNMVTETGNLIQDFYYYQDKAAGVLDEINDKIFEYMEEFSKKEQEVYESQAFLDPRNYEGIIIIFEFNDYKFYYNNGVLRYESTDNEKVLDVRRIIRLSEKVSNSLLTLEYDVKK